MEIIDICAIIYDLLYWIKIIEKKIVFYDFLIIYIHLNGQKLPTFERTDATLMPDF